jgi:hypothetical protein
MGRGRYKEEELGLEAVAELCALDRSSGIWIGLGERFFFGNIICYAMSHFGYEYRSSTPSTFCLNRCKT